MRRVFEEIDALLRRILDLERRATHGGGGLPAGAHAATHADGESDELDVTTLAGYPGGSPTTYLDSDGEFSDPGSSSPHASTHYDGGSDEADITQLGGFPGGSPPTYLDSDGNFSDPGSGGGGDSTHTAAYGSRPAASNAGDLFLPNDGFYLERDTGAAWVPWGPLFPFTAPVSGDYAWINQGSASVVTTNGGIYLSTIADVGTGPNLRIRKKAAPSTPWTVTIAFIPLMVSASHTVGLVFRQSSDGKLVSFGLESGVTPRLTVYKYNSPTSFSASYTTLDLGFRPSMWIFRIADNGTNRICSFSYDGRNFFQVSGVSRTDFLTADEVGFFIQSANLTNGVGMTLLSWAQT